MKIIFDASPETMYPLAGPGFSGGSQVYIKAIVRGLLARGHEVHVIAPDLQIEERRGVNEFWWPVGYHPRQFDVAVMQMHARENPPYEAPVCVLMTSCVDPYLGPGDQWADAFEAVPVFSQTHKELLLATRPTIKPERIHITGLGVDLGDYPPDSATGEETVGDCVSYHAYKIPGRMLYANDPARGLFYTLDIFDEVRKRVPQATLHVTYDFVRQMGYRQWEHSQMAQYLWECKYRLENTPGVVNVGAPERDGIVREQLECQVHCMPSDPPGIGTQTHGITQMECGAAGAALVLSDVEAFPEVFGEGATILPRIGQYLPEAERRVTAADYAEVVSELMQDPAKWAEESRRARALAEANTWDDVVARWATMLETLTGVAW